MLSTRPSTVSQNVTNGDRVFPEKYLASISGCQAGFHSSNHMRDQTSSNSDIHSGLHAYSESISRNYVSSYLDSNLASETDSLPYALSCPDMGDYRAFENANSDHSVRLFGSQFLTSCPPAIPEVQSDVSHDEHVPHPCSCFCTFCAPILPKTYCTDVCCPKLNCLVSTDSLCKPDAFFCLLFTRRCKCRLFSFPRHRVTNENLIILSIIQLLCGFAAIVLSSVAFTKAVFLYQIATGLWAGLLMVITGFHGLFAARRPVVCALIGLLVLCMMVSLAACVLICVSVAGIIEDGFLGNTGARKAFPREIISISSGFRENTTYQKHGQKSTVITLTPRTAGWSEFDQVQLLDFKNVLSETSDSYLRTCQIILHLLLLLVGILEASVSLATSILCCRCVCSTSPNFRFQNSRSLRTNIVSFNAATANQAASVLRSGAINDFVGSGNVLLALDTDVPIQREITNSSSEAARKPQIHHTLIPFLSDLNRHSLILTQAGNGTVALSAARAAANLVDTRRLETPDRTSVSRSSNNEQSSAQRPHTLSRTMIHRLRGCRLGRSSESRPRLLYTTLQIPANLSSDSDSFPNPPPFSPTATIVYVMPSPTHEEPPMIFPPFPPSYSESQRRSLNTPISRVQRNQCMALQSHQPRRHRRRSARYGISHPRFHPSVGSHLSRLFCRYNSCRLDPLWTTNTSRRSRATYHLSRTAASPISVGDRLIQPVLIIGDPVTVRLAEDPPPKYSR